MESLRDTFTSTPWQLARTCEVSGEGATLAPLLRWACQAGVRALRLPIAPGGC